MTSVHSLNITAGTVVTIVTPRTKAMTCVHVGATPTLALWSVPCFHGSASEVYLERAFDGTGWRPAERLPVARELGETSIAFLVHPTLTDAEVEKTCDAIDGVMLRATA